MRLTHSLAHRCALVGVLTALLIPILSSACAKAPPNLSPSGAAAFQATRVVKAIDLVRDTAIAADAQTPPLVSPATTRAIVTWHRAAVTTIGAAPSGWKPTVTTGLDQVDRALAEGERAVLAPYLALARALIAEVQ